MGCLIKMAKDKGTKFIRLEKLVKKESKETE